MSRYQHLRVEVSEGIATIQLFRPKALNAFSTRMSEEIVDAFDRSDSDDDIRAVIVTGEGDRAFCAGADLSGGGDTFGQIESSALGEPVPRDAGGVAALRIYGSRKPVIGAINGAAVGIGATLTLPMDIRLASTTARFGFVFARRGLVPEAASSWFLPRIVGISRALEWCYAGELIPAHEAYTAGLVRNVYPPEELLPAARKLALSFTDRSSPVSISLTRQMLWRMLSVQHPMEAHRVDSRALQLLGSSGDVREGVESFLGKRPPHFTSRVSTDVPDVFAGWEEPEFH